MLAFPFAQHKPISFGDGWPRVWWGLGVWAVALLSAGWALACSEVVSDDGSWADARFEGQAWIAGLVSVGAFIGGCMLTIGGLVGAGVPIALAVLAPLVPVALVLAGWRLELARQRLVAREATATESAGSGDDSP